MFSEERKEYLDERHAATKWMLRSSGQYDNGALIVSGTTLVVSMVFLRHAMSPPLLVGWLMLAVGILAVLASFLTSLMACREAISVLDRRYEGGEPDAESNGYWTGATHVLNWASLIAISLGVLLVVIAVAGGGE